MEITEVRLTLREESKLKAYASITFDNCFVVRNIRVVKVEKGLLVCMPSKKLSDGTHRDLAHPITNECRKMIEDKVLEAYRIEVKKSGD